MAPKTAKKAIKAALANISNEHFKEFCSELRDRPGEPKVPMNRVEGKTFLEIADVLVTTFTEARAIEVTAELLEEIGCNAQAAKLREETSGQSSTASSSNSAAAGVNTAARGGSAEAAFVVKHRTALIDRVTNVVAILDDLLDKEVVTQGSYDEIKDIKARRDQMRELYSGPLHAAGPRGKEVFYGSLQKHEKFLINDLQENQ